MIGAIPRTDLMTSAVESCDANSILIGFGAAVGEEERIDIAGRQFSKLCTQASAHFGGHERVGVGERRSLVLNGANHSLVAMTDVDAHELTVEVNEAFTFGRPEVNSFRAC